jgi:hypothetical protein
VQPDRGRLRELKEALLLGDPVDDRLRFELVGLLEYVAATLPNPRGRPQNEALRQRAGVVGVLHERHGMKLELALNIVAEGSTEAAKTRDRDGLRAAYRRMKASPQRVLVPERVVIATLARAAMK